MDHFNFDHLILGGCLLNNYFVYGVTGKPIPHQTVPGYDLTYVNHSQTVARVWLGVQNRSQTIPWL